MCGEGEEISREGKGRKEKEEKEQKEEAIKSQNDISPKNGAPVYYHYHPSLP